MSRLLSITTYNTKGGGLNINQERFQYCGRSPSVKHLGHILGRIQEEIQDTFPGISLEVAPELIEKSSYNRVNGFFSECFQQRSQPALLLILAVALKRVNHDLLKSEQRTLSRNKHTALRTKR